MRRINHENLKFFFAIGRIVTLRSPHISTLCSTNATVLYNHNSRLVRLVNLSIMIRRRIIFSVSRNSNENAELRSNIFLIRIKKRCTPPNLQAYSSGGDRLAIAIGESGLRGLDAEGLINSGYWVPGEAFVNWLWPAKCERLHFLYTPQKTLETDRFICQEAWIVRKASSKISGATLRSNHSDVSIYPGGLLFTQSSIIDSDRSQNSETYRRGLFEHTDCDVKFRSLETEVVEVAQGSFIGANLDFLYFESLAYGLPKLLQFLKDHPDPQVRSQKLIVNSHTHPATLSLFYFILSERNYEPVIQPSRELTFLVSRLDVYHCAVDWVGRLLEFRNEIREMGSQLGKQGNSKDFPERIFLIRALGARELPNRVPKNIESLIKIASEFEYQTIDPGSLTLPEQIELFRNVEFIISPHGGGLVNLIWGERNPSVLEIFSGWNDSCFEDLALGFGLDYEAFYCHKDPNDARKGGGNSNNNVTNPVGDEVLFRLAIKRQLARIPKL